MQPSSIASQQRVARQGASQARCFGPVRIPGRTLPVRCAAKAEDAVQQPLEGLPTAALLAAPLMLLDVPSAMATAGEYGLLEGRTAALIHPAVMFFLFGGTLYAGYLGYQWKRTRQVRGWRSTGLRGCTFGNLMPEGRHINTSPHLPRCSMHAAAGRGDPRVAQGGARCSC